MKQVGMQITCDRCGHSEFKRNLGATLTHLLGNLEDCYDGGFYVRGWGSYENKDLCPDCWKELTKLSRDFMRDGRE